MEIDLNNTTDLALNAVSFLSDAQLLSLLEEFERKGSLSPALRFSSASGMVTDITAHVIVAMQRSIDGWEGPVVAKRYAEDLVDCRCTLLKSSLISQSEHKKASRTNLALLLSRLPEFNAALAREGCLGHRPHVDAHPIAKSHHDLALYLLPRGLVIDGFTPQMLAEKADRYVPIDVTWHTSLDDQLFRGDGIEFQCNFVALTAAKQSAHTDRIWSTVLAKPVYIPLDIIPCDEDLEVSDEFISIARELLNAKYSFGPLRKSLRRHGLSQHSALPLEIWVEEINGAMLASKNHPGYRLYISEQREEGISIWIHGPEEDTEIPLTLAPSAKTHHKDQYQFSAPAGFAPSCEYSAKIANALFGLTVKFNPSGVTPFEYWTDDWKAELESFLSNLDL